MSEKKRDGSKVLSIDNYRRSADDDQGADEKSVHQLLVHMRRVRDAVPVNNKLQEELYQKLLNAEKTNVHVPANRSGSKIVKNRPTLLLAGLLLLLIIIPLLFWHNSANKKLHAVGEPNELVRFWNINGNVAYTLSPNGELLISRHGQLLLADKERSYRILDLPENWLYYAPSYSPDGKKVAMVRQNKAGEQQIVMVSADELTGLTKVLPSHNLKVLAQGTERQYFNQIVWSPNGTKLAYTAGQDQKQLQVFTVSLADAEPKFVVNGSNPAWSPDNTKLVVQRQTEAGKPLLFLVDPVSGEEIRLGQGEQPAWSANGYLAFVVTGQRERVLTFAADGSPQHTVRQKVAEIRSVYAGKNGNVILKKLAEQQNWLALSSLLFSPEERVTAREMDWLRQMELQGISEPRALLLDDIDRCQNPLFDYQGKILLFVRQEAGSAAVLSVNLEEQLFNRGEK